MEKIIVEVYVPSAEEKFDIFIPLTSKMSEIINLVIAALNEFVDGKYKKTKDSILCEAETGKIYDINKSVQELEIKNGSKLILI